jgi:predicted metal-binding membrane protein
VPARAAGGPALVAGLALFSLLALVAWGASPYARWLDHAHAPSSPSSMLVYLAGWLLMTAAMMLPTTLGLVGVFARVLGARPDRRKLQLGLVSGFLAVWLAVGYTFRALDVLVHAAVDASAWLSARPSLIGAASLALAGAYQFSPVKHRCLTNCRSPRSFVLRGWTGARPRADALRIGAAYGRSCASCCWALMLVMFGIGAASLGWMLALATVMGGERFLPERARVRLEPLLGAVLLTLAVVLAARA